MAHEAIYHFSNISFGKVKIYREKNICKKRTLPFPAGFLEPEHPLNSRQPLPLPGGQRVLPRGRHQRRRRGGEVRLRPDEGGTPAQRQLPQGGDGLREAGNLFFGNTFISLSRQLYLPLQLIPRVELLCCGSDFNSGSSEEDFGLFL